MKRSLALLAVLAILLVPAVVRPDALVVTMAMNASTIAEFFVDDDGVTVELEIGVTDLMGFRDLLPADLYEVLVVAAADAEGLPAPDIEPVEDRRARFFRDDLRIVPNGGAPLPGSVVSIEPGRRIARDQVTGDPLPLGEDAEASPVIRATLFYPFAARPDALTFDAPTNDDGAVDANVGFVVYHKGLHANDFRYLATGMTLDLDWDDPWYSSFPTRGMRRQYYAPVNGFLYIEPFEVRKEIVARPVDLQEWVDLGLRPGQEVITVAEQEEMMQRAAEFLGQHVPVTIDGRAAQGEFDRVHFIYRNLRTSGVIDPPQDLPVVSATLGVIYVFPTDGLPDTVTMEWDLWSDRIDSVPTSATDEAGGLPYVVSPDDPVLTWTNFLTNPTLPGLVTVAPPPPPWARLMGMVAALAVVALLAIGVLLRRQLARREGAATAVVLMLAVVLVLSGSYYFTSARVSDDSVSVVLDGLLENVYRAFDYRQEEVIYDSLENTVAGDLLTDIYLQTRRSLELENQGGARAKVKDVEILDATYEPLGSGGGFTSEARWNVSGSVGHWGHIHERINQYRARIAVESIDGAWRITDLEILEEERIDPGATPVTAPPR